VSRRMPRKRRAGKWSSCCYSVLPLRRVGPGCLWRAALGPELNIAVSLSTFVAACALTARVVSEGPLVVAHEQFFIDPSTFFSSR